MVFVAKFNQCQMYRHQVLHQRGSAILCFSQLLYTTVSAWSTYSLDGESSCLWDLDHCGSQCVDALSVRASIRFPR